MSCPTCGHTMALLTSPEDSPGRLFFHCERCGTVQSKVRGEVRDSYVPLLVSRVMALWNWHNTPPVAEPHPLAAKWHQLGLFEAVYLPERRPQQP